MDADRQVAQICAAIEADSRISKYVVSAIWIGSRSTGIDVHAGSDIDLQLILDHPPASAMTALSELLAFQPRLDLSILHVRDVLAPDGSLDFQDGTKGAFFIPVLASGTVLLGSDFYSTVRRQLTLAAVESSLRFTIREYLGRLRVMVAQGESRPFEFKKYVFKYLKDVLVYRGDLGLEAMVLAANADVLRLCQEAGAVEGPALALLEQSADYAMAFDTAQKAVILAGLEGAYDALLRRGACARS